MKFLTEFGPLLLFGATYYMVDMTAAILVLIPATAIGCLAQRFHFGRFSPQSLVLAALVAIFGGLTIWLQDETFIKIKPTLVSLLFALLLLVTRALRIPILKHAMGEALSLPDRDWLTLATRFAFFFMAMAALNEIVRRWADTDVWVLFKVAGSMFLTFGFLLTQIPLLRRGVEAKTTPAAEKTSAEKKKTAGPS